MLLQAVGSVARLFAGFRDAAIFVFPENWITIDTL